MAANLYAKSVFGEDALVNVSVEKQPDGKLAGYIRIRSKTQGIALSLGDKCASLAVAYWPSAASAARTTTAHASGYSCGRPAVSSNASYAITSRRCSGRTQLGGQLSRHFVKRALYQAGAGDRAPVLEALLQLHRILGRVRFACASDARAVGDR